MNQSIGRVSLLLALIASPSLTATTGNTERSQAILQEIAKKKESGEQAEDLLKLYEEAAALGSAEAQYELVLNHYYARNCPKNDELAYKWCAKAEAQGFVPAISFMGLMHEKGAYVKQDDKKAAEYYKRAADKGYIISAICLVDMYNGGQVEWPGDEVFFHYLEIAAASRESKYQCYLADCYLYAKGTERNVDEGIAIYTTYAQRGDVNALMGLGLAILSISESQEQVKQALAYLDQAAKLGHIGACRALSDIFTQGTYGIKDVEKGRNYEQMGVVIKNNIDKLNLAADYLEGKNGVEKNPEKAAQLLQEAAEAGYAKAQTYLALLYFMGNGVEKNPEKLIYWLEKAAAQGEPDAIAFLKRVSEQ